MNFLRNVKTSLLNTKGMGMPVLKVILCCNNCGYPPNEDRVVHWRIYLVVRDQPQLAIRVDMKCGGADGRVGTLKMEEVPYHYSQGYAAGYEIDVVRKYWTPRLFESMLKAYALDAYYYGPGPSGCRYWCTMVLRCMSSVGFLPPGSNVGFETQIAYLNAKDPVKYPLPLYKGIFTKSKSIEIPFGVRTNSELLNFSATTNAESSSRQR